MPTASALLARYAHLAAELRRDAIKLQGEPRPKNAERAAAMDAVIDQLFSTAALYDAFGAAVAAKASGQ